jgi:ABC-2 type transport system permease protein
MTRSPVTLIAALTYPIIIVLLFGSIFGRSVDVSYNLSVLDLDQSDQSSDFCAYLKTNTTLTISEIQDNSIEPITWMAEKNQVILLVIPENWGYNINNSLSTNLTVYYDESSSTAKGILEIVNEAVTKLNFQILGIDTPFGLIQDDYYLKDIRFIDSFIPGLIIVCISISVLIIGLNSDLDERASGVLIKYATTPVRKIEWIFAKQIWRFLMVISTSFIIILFALIFNYQISTLNPLMLLLILFGMMTFSGISMILVRLIDNPDGVMATSVLIILPQIFLSGTFVPLDSLPRFIQILAYFTPMYYLSEGMRLVMLEFARTQFWTYFIANILFALGFFIIGYLLTTWRSREKLAH